MNAGVVIEQKNFNYLTAILKTYLPQAEELSGKILSADQKEGKEAKKNVRAIQKIIDTEIKEMEYERSLKDITGCSLWEIIRENNQAQIQCLVKVLEEIGEHKRQRFEEEKTDFIIGCSKTGEPVNPGSVTIDALEKIEEAANLAEKLGMNPNTFILEAMAISASFLFPFSNSIETFKLYIFIFENFNDFILAPRIDLSVLNKMRSFQNYYACFWPGKLFSSLGFNQRNLPEKPVISLFFFEKIIRLSRLHIFQYAFFNSAISIFIFRNIPQSQIRIEFNFYTHKFMIILSIISNLSPRHNQPPYIFRSGAFKLFCAFVQSC